MEIKINAVHFDATEKLEAYIEKKVGRLEKILDGEQTVQVDLKLVKPQTANNKTAALAVQGLRVEKTADTFENAIDGCIDALKVQIIKKKEKE